MTAHFPPEWVITIAGIRTPGFVDPTSHTLEAFELHEGRWALIASAKDDDLVGIRPFDAVTFSLGDLWP